MKTRRYKKLGGILLMTLTLVGCGQKNPLMNQDFIQTMKSEFFLNDDAQFPIRLCSRFYANPSMNSAFSGRCASWSNDYYHTLISMGDIPSNISLANFRDAHLWQAILQN